MTVLTCKGNFRSWKKFIIYSNFTKLRTGGYKRSFFESFHNFSSSHINKSLKETYLVPCPTSAMELSAKIVNGWKNMRQDFYFHTYSRDFFNLFFPSIANPPSRQVICPQGRKTGCSLTLEDDEMTRWRYFPNRS